MGEKGARLTADASARAEALAGEWAPLGKVTTRRMFGGYGVFESEKMFAIIDSKGALYLKADAETQAVFEQAGASKHARMPYWSVPGSILDDEQQLQEWAKRAIEVSSRS